MRFAATILTLFLVTSPLAAKAEEIREIIVTGEGRVSTEPDMAVISLGVTREARTASEAMKDANVAVAKVLEDVEKAGVLPRDVQTASISLSPRWDHSKNNAPPQVTGYVASNTLSVRVRDLDLLGGLLDTVVGSGANTMNGLGFRVADPRPLEDEARVAAVNDARAKAGLLAEAGGARLGPVRTITEGAVQVPGMPIAQGRMMMESSAVPVATGEIDIRVSVTVVFSIEDDD
ncbi:MAG: SIMPL domain-containing protein [Silicimonas sp.]|nr:SIMPL domain-containing protein [Silicimonas sp.]